MEDRMMFDRGSYDVAAFGFKEPGNSENGEIDAFRTAAGKNKFARFTAENLRSPVSGVIEQCSSSATDVVDAGGIAPNFGDKRQHGFANLRVERSGRVI